MQRQPTSILIMKTKLTLPLLLFLALSLSACSPNADLPASPAPQPAPAIPTLTNNPGITPPATDEGITAISSNSMRFLPVHTDLASAAQIDIPLAGKPLWVAGIPFEDGSAWAVALSDGSLQAFYVAKNDYTPLSISPAQLTPGSHLTIYAQNGRLFALTAPPDASPLTTPILLDGNKLAYIATSGELVITQDGGETRLPVNALPDSLLIDNLNRLLLLSNPTDSYTHGVLGDAIEATSITLLQTDPEVKILNTIAIPAPDVIEGIYPIWADMNIDGELEIIVTLSNAQDGARMVAFHEDGSIVAEGPPIGTGYRWRHQLMVAPFRKSSEMLLAVVRTPHIGGVVEYYHLSGNKLEIVAEVPGISTHSIGSRNLFTAQAGDFDDDGLAELLAPDRSHTQLGIVGIDGETQRLELGAELCTNLSAVILPDSGESVLAAGLSNNALRVWLP